MFSKKYLNISDFAKITGVSRQTLIYYDRIGLFSPAYVAENKYRMYSHKQADNLGIITILSDLGVPLKKIKEILAEISVGTIKKTLAYQIDEIAKKIEKLSVLKNMTQIRLEQISSGESFPGADSPRFHLIEIEENIPVRISDKINRSQENIDDETIVDFFENIEKEGLPMIFSLGYIKDSANILKYDYNTVSYFWFRLKDEKYANAFIPAGKYIVGYAKGDYGNTNYIYDELSDFACRNNLKINGNVYEEYLIDELCEKNPNEYIMQVFVKTD